MLANNAYYSDVTSVDVHSKEFDSLPPEVQHELLLERQQIEKYSFHDPDTLPQVRSFSRVTCTYRILYSGGGTFLLRLIHMHMYIIAYVMCRNGFTTSYDMRVLNIR